MLPINTETEEKSWSSKMNDGQGISASVPLLGNYNSQESQQERDKNLLSDNQDSLHCQYQAWPPSLSQVSFMSVLYFCLYSMLLFSSLIKLIP